MLAIISTLNYHNVWQSPMCNCQRYISLRQWLVLCYRCTNELELEVSRRKSLKKKFFKLCLLNDQCLKLKMIAGFLSFKEEIMVTLLQHFPLWLFHSGNVRYLKVSFRSHDLTLVRVHVKTTLKIFIETGNNVITTLLTRKQRICRYLRVGQRTHFQFQRSSSVRQKHCISAKH